MWHMAEFFFSLRHFGQMSLFGFRIIFYDWKKHYDRIDLIFFGHFKKIRSKTEKKQIHGT